ncbi:DUF7500 family protein [Halobellus rufus]|uniref:DUF7500 family protein n=1 Tax=Halobellus rufus TaxID=1448860 RepID=UPI00067941CC|nr:hypothetical protein [Halobellus rufus]
MAPSDQQDDTPARARSEEGVVRPDDLDYTGSERVAELSDGRYVIATDNDDAPSVEGDGDEEAEGPDDRGTLARQQTSRYLSERGGDYSLALTAAFDGEIRHHESVSDDVATTFGDLVTWYVDQIDTEASTSEAIGILLLASETSVTYPTNALASVLQTHGLSLDDSIGDLVDALREEEFQLPADE